MPETGLVIVAIPEQEDPVWDVSSQKVPHMTLLWLGDVKWSQTQIDEAAGFVEHASSMINRFGMGVDHRGELGDLQADVLFFEKDWSFDMIDQFRAGLLANNTIKTAWLAADQHPEWTPHLTLGYPDAPAKPNPRDHPIGWVSFDRIALWPADFDGPTFELKRNDHMDVAMGDRVLQFLSHHGVKGMKWGVRKSRSAKSGTTTRTKFKKPPHKLSDAEINKRIKRMELEKKYNQLNKKDASKGEQIAKDVMENIGTRLLKGLAAGATVVVVERALSSRVNQQAIKAVINRLT